MGACLSVPRVMTPLRRLSTKVLGWYSAFWGVWHLTLKKQNLLQKSLWFLHILYQVFHINKPLRWRSSRIRCQTCVERWPACSSAPEYFLQLTFQNCFKYRGRKLNRNHLTGATSNQTMILCFICICVWICICICIRICICRCPISEEKRWSSEEEPFDNCDSHRWVTCWQWQTATLPVRSILICEKHANKLSKVVTHHHSQRCYIISNPCLSNMLCRMDSFPISTSFKNKEVIIID